MGGGSQRRKGCYTEEEGGATEMHRDLLVARKVAKVRRGLHRERRRWQGGAQRFIGGSQRREGAKVVTQRKKEDIYQGSEVY